MSLNGKRIYVVDDDDAVRDSLKVLLATQGAIVEDFGSCEDFMAAYEGSAAACLVLDVHLPGMNGLDLLGRLKASRIAIPVILISGNPGADIVARAFQMGVVDFLDKPVGLARLLEALVRAFETQAPDSPQD